MTDISKWHPQAKRSNYMSPSDKLKISTLKNYSYKEQYEIVKKTRLDEIRKDLSFLFGGSKKEHGKGTNTSASKPFKFNILMIMGSFIGMLLLMYVLLLSMMPTPSQYQNNYVINNSYACHPLKYIISDSDIVDFGTSSHRRYSAYALLHFLDIPPKGCSVNLWTTKKYVDDDIYLLYIPLSDPGSQQKEFEFENLFKKIANSYGLSVNIISPQKLDGIPSYSLVVIPTGYFPKQLLDTGVLNMMLGKNINVIFIGNSFDQGLINSKGDLVSGNKHSFIRFSSGSSKCNNLSLSNPLYTVRSGQSNQNFGAYHGCISFYKPNQVGNEGILLFVPQSLDTGWDNYSSAVFDILDIIIEQPWSTPNLVQTYNCSSMSKNGNLALFSLPMVDDHGGLVISVTTCNRTQYTLFNVKKSMLGHIYTTQEGVIVPFEMSTEQTMFWVEPASFVLERRQFYINMYKNGYIFGKPIPLGYLNTNTGKSINSEVHTEKSNYLFVLQDDKGNKYAKLYLRSTFVDLSYAGKNGDSHFLFNINRDGVPYKLKYVTLDVDHGLYKFKYNNIDSIEVTLPEDLPPGKHIFTFHIGAITKSIPITVEGKSSLFSDPLVMGAILISILLFGVGYIFEKKEKIKYSLDIPDFISSKRRHIELPAVKILSLFDKINKEYGWDHTPLKLNEIRREILKLIHNSRQVNITEYNTETLLSHLCQWGYLYKVGDYYVPLSWVKETKKSPKYLAIFRRLRDSCIKNAIHFTEFNLEKNVDSILNVNEHKIYVHIIDDVKQSSPRVISRTLKLIPKGINVVLFYDSYELEKFNDILLIPDVPNTLFKLEADFWSVILTDFNSLDKILRKIKFM